MLERGARRFVLKFISIVYDRSGNVVSSSKDAFTQPSAKTKKLSIVHSKDYYFCLG